ncbi:hypothetical protein CLU79DRAFT_763641 [Phycomyces nitens]|nr:hypothetical protein CLU79DRAFT_763641 [Phycomyces nitens]
MSFETLQLPSLPKHQNQQPILLDEEYHDDESTTITGNTMSTLGDQDIDYFSPPQSSLRQTIEDPENARVSRYQNTYFMDGGNRFISLPTLGNTTTKAASHISRIFEEWLQQKLYNASFDRLPILEDSVELIAEDVLNTLKLRSSIRGLTGLSNAYVKIRTGHIYTYHQLEDGQPLITEDMEDFFQQFPLFIEVIVYTMTRNSPPDQDYLELLISVENLTVNPNQPYSLSDQISI